MYTLPVILFCSGVVLGGIHGYFLGITAVDLIFSIAVGGFLGSALGGALFIYIYMSHREPGESETPVPLESTDAGSRQIHRLKEDINALKQKKEKATAP